MEIINYSGKKSYRSSVARKNVLRRETSRPRFASAAVAAPRNYGMKSFLMTLREATFLFLKTLLRIVEFGWIIPAAFACIYFPKKKVDEHAYRESFANPVEVCMDNDWAMEFLDNTMSSFAMENTPQFDAFGYLYAEDGTVPLPKLEMLNVTWKTVRYNMAQNITGLTQFMKSQGLSNLSTLISCNNIKDVSEIPSKLRVPSMDGIQYKVRSGDTLSGIAKKYSNSNNKITLANLLDVNSLDSETLSPGQELFVPGGWLPASELEKVQGEKFAKPLYAKYYLTSKFGPRIDPISGKKSSHTGIDMACPTGTPIYASMSGTVQVAGWHNSYGNYVIIKHKDGYQTLYGHMSKILTTKGEKVTQGQKIGLVGSTGYSTGPHLHFTVYKNGTLVDPLTLLK